MPWSPDELRRYAEKVLLAREVARREHPGSGTTGLELEWNLLDSRLRPLETVGTGPAQQSFADVLRGEVLPAWLAERTQLEVFHWMIEWTTRPYSSPVLTVYEARLLEACQRNALARAGRRFGERLFAWHGNLLAPVRVGHHSIPGGWNLAKRRYLETCVDRFGANLATAGIHANLSLPEPMLVWDFMHLPTSGRSNGHLDGYKNRVYTDCTRRMRAFAGLFIATSASTPLQPDPNADPPGVLLTEFDSIRTLTFPSPENVDLPDLYRSHADYLRLSYELVRRGIRIGNNNWTAVRARSFAEPVERLISISSTELERLYHQGLYALGEQSSVEEMAREIVVQNLLARIDLPMARVEVRTDEGGHPLALEIANLAFKEILLLRLYGDPDYAGAFRYDAEDLRRARRSEHAAAQYGLRAEIEDPLGGGRIGMRAFLRRTLEEVDPLAEALGQRDLLEPLHALAAGAPNTAERLRHRLREELHGGNRVPEELLRSLVEAREQELARDIEHIALELMSFGEEASRLRELWSRARDDALHDPGAPIGFEPAPGAAIEVGHSDKTTEIVELARRLIRIPSVSGAPVGRQRIDEIRRAATFVFDYLRQAGLEVRIFEQGRFPAVLASFPGGAQAPLMLSGHFDVVEPEPDDGQFEPMVEGEYLWGRGACDMKTVVATYLVWMKDARRRAGAFPPVTLLLVGNEEIGEGEPDGTPHVLQVLRAETGYAPGLLIAGERTGERGDELVGQVCVANRGLARLEIEIRGARAHTGFGVGSADPGARLFRAREDLQRLLAERLSLQGSSGWGSQLTFPFVRLGDPGVFNITADRGLLGVEVRPIPGDDLAAVLSCVEGYALREGLEVRVVAAEPGIACSPGHPLLEALLESIREATGVEPALGRKLAATSARFAPDGQGVVWGQTGIGPHAAGERHFIPSIGPYYDTLVRLGDRLQPERMEAARARSKAGTGAQAHGAEAGSGPA